MIQKRPFAIEQERINFEYPPGEPLARPLVSQESSCAL
jgi:hypothetical protein